VDGTVPKSSSSLDSWEKEYCNDYSEEIPKKKNTQSIGIGEG
jgi:hypothetical protein